MPVLPIMLAGALASSASAEDEPRLEAPVAARPIALGRYNLQIGAETGLRRTTDNGVLVTIPIRFGISKDLEVFASPVYQNLGPPLRDPQLGAIYRLIDGGIELGVTAYTDLTLFQEQAATVIAGFPVRIHAGSRLSVDTGLLGLLTVVPATYTGVQVPIGVNLNPTDALFVNVSGAARLGDVTDVENAFTIPLTTALGFTVPREDVPLADIGVRATWSDLQTANVLDVVGFVRFFILP